MEISTQATPVPRKAFQGPIRTECFNFDHNLSKTMDEVRYLVNTSSLAT